VITVRELLSQIAQLLERREADWLVAEALDCNRFDLYLRMDQPLESPEVERIKSWLERRQKHEPLSYLSGRVLFDGNRLTVNRHVLIPRPETELMVELVAKAIQGLDLNGKVLWDLCCGSGCIAVALKRRFPQLHVVGVDLSAEALQVARQNGADLEIQWIQGDLLSPLSGQKAHIVVSNPPYVSEGEWAQLAPTVRDFEPRQALVAGPTGLEFYQRFARELPSHLLPGSRVMLELGAGQGEAVQALFAGKGSLESDYSGIQRFFSLVWE
jgi:release factor glutamine methyltransferase